MNIQEDAILAQLVGRHGGKKWSLIAASLNGRLGKQCRERCEWSIYVRVRGVLDVMVVKLVL